MERMTMFNFGLEEEPSIDLTPLIDTIFMLLIFFIMTTTFSRPVLDIVLPASQESEVSTGKREQIISIKADGSLHYEGRQIDKSEVDAVLAERPEALLNLYVDQKAPFEAFVDVVDIAKVRKGGRFVISTQPGGDE
ncbi:biopolymer transporter ExbD [Mailhella massiliensis]|uniref:Biopolymer transporter ExbD n=1 Tax=Mailhella massiliensis TaxID=1903261 RepID=A0A921AV44_9BACT|nr:biopolymer transporter ExbD [Mailhella massiliensis]HJD96626.1 biopolymer transporter ExbD [Mailhella massiliensis]